MARLSSKASILCGLVAICLMGLSFFGNSWLHCQEKTVISYNQITYVAFRIGLWKVCPFTPTDNNTENYQFPEEAACIPVIYNMWGLEHSERVSVWPDLQFIPLFVSRMRVSMPFGGVGIILLAISTIFSLIGHFRLNNSMLFASGLFIVAGIMIGCSLLIFASVLSDTYYEGLTADNETSIIYSYGWSFFYAAAALAMTKMAVVFSVTSYMYKYGTVEEMVRAMVPGAERRLRLQIANDYAARLAPEVVPPPAPYRDTEPPTRPDLCGELKGSKNAPPTISINQGSVRFKTLSGREPRYAAPPRPPAQFYSLPRRPASEQKQNFCSKSAV